MGLYIEDTDTQTKEQRLAECAKGRLEPKNIDWNTCVEQNCIPVVVVNNGFFTAAAVAYSEKELNDFRSPGDERPKVGYIVPIAEVRELTDNRLDDYLGE